MAWTNTRMLIWGKTYPELSKKHTETVCTGAVLLDRPGLIRLYPIDYRYLPEDQRPEKWSIVTADIDRNFGDAREESYKINAVTIKVESKLGTEDGWAERRRLMLRPDHLVDGVEDMEARQRGTGQSLGIVKPDEIIKVELERTTDEERAEHDQKYKIVTAQKELWPPGEKPVPLPRYKVRIFFRCDRDSRAYDRCVLDWEFIEAAKHHFDRPDPTGSFQEYLWKRAFSKDHEPHLILGNISNYQHTFVIVGVMYPKRQVVRERQLSLGLG